MKKTTILCVGLCAAMAFTSCKSNESAYKRAYEKAKQYDTAAAQQAPQTPQTAAPQTTEEVAVVAPVEAKPANEARVVDNLDNVSVRQENVTVVSGAGLKNFSVVVGSFSLRANADGLQETLGSVGYDAQVVLNSAVQPAMYRVVAATFDTKAEAAASRNDLQTKYPGAWLLYAK
jgi:cell division protein FtsN